MKWLFIIDPIETLKLETDSTYAIIVEAVKRNITCYIATIEDIHYRQCALVHTKQITIPFQQRKNESFLLDDFDIIFMRKEPPYDMNFHYATQLLSLADTKIVNDARALRDYNEKLIILNFPDLIPETIVASNEQDIQTFCTSQKQGVVIKHLDSYQGKMIKKMDTYDENTVCETTNKFTTPVMVQEYLPGITKGDKRIILLEGEFLGAVSRIPSQGSFLSNFGQGGRGEKTAITETEERIIAKVKPFLKKHNLHFVGLDVIDNKLTEINITCPTGIVQINQAEGAHIEKEIVSRFINMEP